MDIEINHIDKYKEVTVKYDNVSFVTSLLNKDQAIDLARLFIIAADELLDN